MKTAVLLLFSACAGAAAETAADLARSLRETALDPQECYRVRELSLAKEDARFYFSEGYLIFGKSAGGARISAVFSGDVEGGDAELVLLPPDRSERKSLASHTGSPNMDEHFRNALFLFTDDTYRDLSEQIRANPFNRRSPDIGSKLAENWTSVIRNVAATFETRMILGLMTDPRPPQGFLAAIIQGKTLGNFDLIYDPRGTEQFLAGQINSSGDRPMFDVWTSFTARSERNRTQPREPEFRLDGYRIEATLEPNLSLKVRTRVKLTPGAGVHRVLPFELSGRMHVSSASVDGVPAEVLQPESLAFDPIGNEGNTLFLVVPSQPLAGGGDHELEFQHEGSVIGQAGRQVYYVSSRGNWYPSIGLEFAHYDLTFRYPKSLDLVTPGNIVEDRTEGDWRITRRTIGAPMRLAGFNLGVYERARSSAGGFNVEVCANRGGAGSAVTGTEPSRLEQLASQVLSAMQFYAGRFGPPPLSSLVVSPIPDVFGQGFPGLIYLSTLSYLAPGAKPLTGLRETDRTFFTDVLEAHETAHQWWGNVVASAGYHDDWLMEALANYSALLYMESRKGTPALEAMLSEYRRDLLTKADADRTVESIGPIVLGGRLVTSLAPAAWKAIIYGKGSWIIHMLRRRMGDERFFAMLAELRRRYEWKTVTTDQFRLLAAEFMSADPADPKLQDFFDQWVNSTGIPVFRLKYSVTGRAPAVKLSGTIRQEDPDSDFSATVPLEVRFASGPNLVHVLHIGGEPVSFNLTLRQPPTNLVLDPALSILSVEHQERRSK